MRRRRGAIADGAARASRERAAKLGREVRQMRIARRWTQQQLADRAGIGRMMVARLEAGTAALDVDVLERIGAACGVPLMLGFGRDPMADVPDAGHLAMQELMLGLARAVGMRRQFELATRPHDSRRSIDVALADDRRRVAIVVECWNTFGDVGAAARSTSRKVAELAELVTPRWVEEAADADGIVSSVWVVRDTARNRALVARFPEIFRARFPGSSAAWVRALTAGGDMPREPGLVWCDLRATRLLARRAARRG